MQGFKYPISCYACLEAHRSLRSSPLKFTRPFKMLNKLWSRGKGILRKSIWKRQQPAIFEFYKVAIRSLRAIIQSYPYIHLWSNLHEHSFAIYDFRRHISSGSLQMLSFKFCIFSSQEGSAEIAKLDWVLIFFHQEVFELKIFTCLWIGFKWITLTSPWTTGPWECKCIRALKWGRWSHIAGVGDIALFHLTRIFEGCNFWFSLQWEFGFGLYWEGSLEKDCVVCETINWSRSIRTRYIFYQHMNNVIFS